MTKLFFKLYANCKSPLFQGVGIRGVAADPADDKNRHHPPP
jgi:hypothetical protein